MIELKSIGTSEIRTDIATITPSQEIVFASALYLIMERGRSISRSRLASVLWCDVPPAIRSHRLRQTLFQLRKLGLNVAATNDVLRVSQADVWVDLDHLPALCLAESSNLPEFLPGYCPAFSQEFEDWLDRTRNSVHSTLTEVLLGLLMHARSTGNWKEVDRIATSCLALDSFNETALLGRAEALVMRGQKTRAVTLLDDFIAGVTAKNPALAVQANVLRKRIDLFRTADSKSHFDATEPDTVGREAEMARLTQLLSRIRMGRGYGCVITGEPGIGKTRLCSELAKFAQLQGMRVERVTCKRSDGAQPLSAFVSLVPKLLELPGAIGISQQSLVWLKRLTEFDLSAAASHGTRDDSGMVYTSVRMAVLDLLDAVSEERSLVLLIDDVQWWDTASAQLFGSILEWVGSRKILLVFASREAGIAALGFAPPHKLDVFKLEPLTDRDASAIVVSVLGQASDKSVPEDLEWLVRVGEGNPYFLQELTKHWIETDRQRELPPSVASVLNERISRLSATALQLLQSCAVLGEHSNLERIELLLVYPPHQLLSGIQELSVAGMLRSGPPDNGRPTLQIRHDLLTIEVLKGLAPPALSFLHRGCGLVLEREVLGTSISTSLLRACAFHWHQAGDSERALDLAIKCGSHLLEIGLASDAVNTLNGALGFCNKVDQRTDVLRRIVDAQYMARDSKGLIETVARIRQLQNAILVCEHHDELEMAEFEAARKVVAEIQPLFLRTLRCVYNKELPAPHRVGVAVVALKLASALPDLAEMRRVHTEISPMLANADIDPRARYDVQIVYEAMCGSLHEAVRLAKERVSFERTCGSAVQLTNAMADLAFVLRLTGPSDQLLAILVEAYEIAMGKKLVAAARDYAERIAEFLISAGRTGAHEWVARALEPDEKPQQPHLVFSTSALRVRLAILENRIADAEHIVVEEFAWDWLKHRRGWLAAALALRIRVRLAQHVGVDRLLNDVEDLHALYGSTANIGAQDSEVASLCAGLAYIGRSREAERLLKDYVLTQRRDLTAYNSDLAAVCEALGPCKAVSRADEVATVL